MPFDLTMCMLGTSSAGGLWFFICLLLLCKLLLCSHRVNLASYANIQTCSEMFVNFSLPGFGNRNRTRKVEPNHQVFPFFAHAKEKNSNLITRVLATCPLHSWVWIDWICITSFEWSLMSWQSWPAPLDPPCSYKLQGNGLRLVLSNLLLSTFSKGFSALPGLGLRQRQTIQQTTYCQRLGK